ncbi:MAG: SsrA-binding protein [Candidatus Edwardsbacteria bacterium RIFOXYD12_FULL_50_11]|jgi:SsrA-binding protein|uniref:SsrA-binding protein n=1 Tax=Candidatus Edwardsbacteria bacterium GWF2_54_11 TaxID=1817851 RepID=A0A1F5RHH2_9BACT|nr:SsrA-binding protein SmpB [Candidatus Edwardsbacteria bacterium]OGF01125.1 MAG: SsrA-binding protein [Candidatus Edwardsbacteria bacterium RifOxyC12_full_54_24]OGF06136.1 MAG: SsrA-binding protein [Candidatus Edwardsbacteria bacterium RifOxyA12_full_54_48]OGF12597.1 MAG: SsrA-binding protein [Candidatus Edwardsbacteria bacterium GWE2_54_12]OGF13866.1 MAG: SsrA-binding protein [Candidatus Edwardsbacteria bacterium GWF2_54_11]OGF17806.1 MAG: SsrA-binding protein [Candidatus Edwardsbacteria ba
MMIESILNKKARYDYEIIDRLETGIVLRGTEVKSIRQGQANLKDSFAMVKGRELFLFNMHVSPYDHGNRYNLEATRPRKLLLHREQIRKLTAQQKEKSLSLIPLSLYFVKGKVKIDLALAKGKKQYDRREDIKKRDVDREMRGTNKGRFRG